MRSKIAVCVGVALVAVLASVSPAQSPRPATTTTKISLTELHCNGCVKKLSNQMVKVPGVASVKGDLPSATLYVTHKPGVNPSPRAMWEAVEKGDHTPTRMEGPSGVFSQKPQQ